MNRHEREFRKIIADAGLEVLSVTRAAHYKVQVRAPDGRTMQMVMPSSPSCHRWQDNQKTTLRHFATGRIERIR